MRCGFAARPATRLCRKLLRWLTRPSLWVITVTSAHQWSLTAPLHLRLWKHCSHYCSCRHGGPASHQAGPSNQSLTAPPALRSYHDCFITLSWKWAPHSMPAITGAATSATQVLLGGLMQLLNVSWAAAKKGFKSQQFIKCEPASRNHLKNPERKPLGRFCDARHSWCMTQISLLSQIADRGASRRARYCLL